MTCLNAIGCDKQTMLLIVLFYPLATIILEAAIMKHFMKFCKIVFSYPEQMFLVAASIINSSICGAAISSILMYFCIAYK